MVRDFEDFVDGLVKEGLGFSGRQMVRFRDVRPSRPPLLLTVTNVSHGRLEVIDLTDPAFADVEIARAVRASGGFPGFFQPMDLPGMREGRCFADGGMVANFPLWVLLGHLPRQAPAVPPFRVVRGSPLDTRGAACVRRCGGCR